MLTPISGPLEKIESLMCHCHVVWFSVNRLTFTFSILGLPWLIKIKNERDTQTNDLIGHLPNGSMHFFQRIDSCRLLHFFNHLTYRVKLKHDICDLLYWHIWFWALFGAGNGIKVNRGIESEPRAIESAYSKPNVSIQYNNYCG